MKNRKDECLCCNSRSCRTRIVRLEAPAYDEIACKIHIDALEEHADEVLGRGNGIYRHHISSTGNLKRGEPIS